MHRRNFVVRAATLLTPLLASGALAAEEHAAGAHAPLTPIQPPNQGVVMGIASIVIFLIVFAFLAWKVWPVISKGLDERANKIRSEIEAAEQAQKQARVALEQYEKSLAEARAEAQRMLTDALAKQQALVAEQKAKAEIELTQMRDRARKDIESAKRTAVEEVYTAAVTQATAMASKILKRELTPRDQQRLVEESLAELGALGKS